MFAELYRSNNVVLNESFGVPYPEAFTDPGSEYHALTTTAGLIDLCHWGVVRLRGGDRVSLFNALTTNRVEPEAAGRGVHSAMVTVKGKLVAELFILQRPDELLVLVAQGDTAEVTATIDKHIIADDVSVENLSDHFGVIAVEGPKCREVVWRLFPDTPLPEHPPYFVEADYQETPVAIVHNTVSGESGYHLLVPGDGIGTVREHLIQSGRAEDMALVGRAAWNTRRVEAGMPWWGADVAPGENFPKECRLEDVVSYNKGCYLGQETLARMHYRGHPNWLLSGVVPADAADRRDEPPAGSEMFAPADSSKAVGRVTSAVFSPALNKQLIMGYVRTGFAQPGTELVLRVGGDEHAVVVTSFPAK